MQDERERIVLWDTTVGSYKHRTNISGSDVDMRTVYRLRLWDRLSPFVEETTRKGTSGDDDQWFELTHFTRMLAKCNPTAIEVAAPDLRGGNTALADMFLLAALDTDKYTTMCNRFVKGMYNANTPKSLHHGWRVAIHLRRYLQTGELEFDMSNYPEYEDLRRVKLGLLTPHDREFDSQVFDTIWHEQDLDKLDLLCYNQYITDTYHDREY